MGRVTRRDTTTFSKTTLACGCFLMGAIVLYLYFLNMSVVQVVMRTDFVQQQQVLQTEIAALDAEYIEAQHTVAGRIADLEGYESEAAKIFVSRKQPSLVFGSN